MKETSIEMPQVIDDRSDPVFGITADGIAIVAVWDGRFWHSDISEQSFGKNQISKWDYFPREIYNAIDPDYYDQMILER